MTLPSGMKIERLAIGAQTTDVREEFADFGSGGEIAPGIRPWPFARSFRSKEAIHVAPSVIGLLSLGFDFYFQGSGLTSLGVDGLCAIEFVDATISRVGGRSNPFEPPRRHRHDEVE